MTQSRDEYLRWTRSFQVKTQSLRVPLSGMIEITSRCNLRCVHCYLGEQSEQHSKREQELSTQQWFDLIDQFVAAGCLYITLTGGDPMMRRDFADIYRHCKESGLVTREPPSKGAWMEMKPSRRRAYCIRWHDGWA